MATGTLRGTPRGQHGGNRQPGRGDCVGELPRSRCRGKWPWAHQMANPETLPNVDAPPAGW